MRIHPQVRRGFGSFLIDSPQFTRELMVTFSNRFSQSVREGGIVSDAGIGNRVRSPPRATHRRFIDLEFPHIGEYQGAERYWRMLDPDYQRDQDHIVGRKQCA